MSKKTEKPSGIRIGRLSELTGVSRDTIKFYLKEGLIPRPFKTGRTMSYYDPSCVQRIALIKKMQSERFLPLTVIRDMLEDEGTAEQELALAEAFLGMSAFSDPVTSVSAREIQEKTGYLPAEIEKIERAGIIGPRRDEPGREFTSIDLSILSLIRRREKAGFTLDYSLLMMGIYRDAIGTIVRKGTQLFATRAAINDQLVTMAQNVSEGERALAEFMPLIRTKLKQDYFGLISVQFQETAGRIADVFDFRCIAIPDSDSDGAALVDGLLFDGPPDPSRVDAGTGLMRGVRVLLGREHEAARDIFGSYRQDPSWGNVAAALEGLSRIGAACVSQWYLDVIRDFRTAVGILESFPETADHGAVRVAADYLRGAGLAIIPDSFDTHASAARLLEGLGPRAEAAGGTADNDRRTFMGEIGIKARMILATTYRYDGDTSKARSLLEEIAQHPETPSHYRDRARRQLARIE
jgi:DNA-binding transcriptional MerR regulator